MMSNDKINLDKESKNGDSSSHWEYTSTGNNGGNKGSTSSNNRTTGLVLIVIGLVWLLSRFTNFNIFSIRAIFNLWPLIFVVIGVNILFKNRPSVRLISWALFIIIVVIFSNTNLRVIDTGIPELNSIQSRVIQKVNSSTDRYFGEDSDYEFSHNNYSNFIKSNRLNSDMLLKVDSKNSKDYFEVSSPNLEVVNLSSATLNLKASNENRLVSTYDYVDAFEKIDDDFGFYVITKEKYQTIEKKFDRDLEIELDDKMQWDISIDAGAVSGELDFSNIDLDRLEINSGASSYSIKLPSDDFRLEFNGGASSVEFEVPSDLGVHLEINGVLVNKNISERDFYKKDGEYYSNNYEEAEHKATIEVNVATGDFEIKVK